MRGLEFSTDSTSVKIVVSSSKFNEALPKILLKHDFVDLTRRSQKLPRQAARSTMYFQVIPLSAKKLL